MIARDKFSRGDRVVMSDIGLHNCPSSASAPTGIVTGFSVKEYFVRVLQDGYTFQKTMHMRHWDIAPKLIPTWTKNGFVFVPQA